MCPIQEDVDADSIATFNKRQMLPSAKELGVSTLPSHGYYTLVAVDLILAVYFVKLISIISPPLSSL